MWFTLAPPGKYNWTVLCGVDATLRQITLTTCWLWPPCVADADIIFVPCDFYLLSIFFYSSSNFSGRRLDVYHTSTQCHDVVQCEFRIHVWNVLHAAHWKYRMQKIAICAPSHNFVGLNLRNKGAYRQSEKILVKQQYLFAVSVVWCSHSRPYRSF